MEGFLKLKGHYYNLAMIVRVTVTPGGHVAVRFVGDVTSRLLPEPYATRLLREMRVKRPSKPGGLLIEPDPPDVN